MEIITLNSGQNVTNNKCWLQGRIVSILLGQVTEIVDRRLILHNDKGYQYAFVIEGREEKVQVINLY